MQKHLQLFQNRLKHSSFWQHDMSIILFVIICKFFSIEYLVLPVELRVESALDEASVAAVKSSESDSKVLRES